MNFFDRHQNKIAFVGPDDCWLWTAAKSSKGYVAVKARGKVRGCREHGTCALGRRYGVGNTLVGMTVKRELWRHIS